MSLRVERRWWIALFLTALGVVVAVALLAAQLRPAIQQQHPLGIDNRERGVTLAIGRVGATDQELQECYFNFGSGAMLTLHPKGEPCVLARELIGRTGALVFVPD